MDTVTLSSKYQIVIPRSVREHLGLKPSQRFTVLHDGNQIRLVPLESPHKLRGFLPGIDTAVPRDEDRP